MTDILLAIIAVELFLILLANNRVGEWIGRTVNKLVYRWRTRKL